LPLIVEAHARTFTIPAAHCRLKTVTRCNHDASTRKSPHRPRCHHDTTSKHQTAPDPTTKVVPDQHRPEEEHHHLAEKLVARTLQPATASHDQATAARGPPQPARAGRSQPLSQPRLPQPRLPRPATTGQPRPGQPRPPQPPASRSPRPASLRPTTPANAGRRRRRSRPCQLSPSAAAPHAHPRASRRAATGYGRGNAGSVASRRRRRGGPPLR
jgi:hypothetical protein